jgi:hypothetical protein
MKIQEAKKTAKTLTELSDCGKELFCSIKDTAQTATSPQKLWREGNKSNLIKMGMAIFFFPEPTPVCEIIGAGVIAVGAIQQGIKSQAIYAEDIPKTLRKTFKELNESRFDLRI